jgi:hypothetical protein
MGAVVAIELLREQYLLVCPLDKLRAIIILMQVRVKQPTVVLVVVLVVLLGANQIGAEFYSAPI